MGGGIQGDDPLLVPADALQHPAGEIQIVHVQRDQLADPDAGGIEQLQHGPVPAALGVGGLRLGQEQLHLPAGEDLGQLALHLGGGHRLGRVGRHLAPQEQIVIKGLDGGQRAGHRGGGLAQNGELVDIALHFHRRDLSQRALLLLHGGGELPHIPEIGADRVGRRLLLRLQIVLIGGDPVRHHRSLPPSFL